MTDTQLMLIDERTLKDKIYTIRGQQVMLDSDLAEIYGYSTKAFNQQVKNNIEKFDEDFRFQLTRQEVEDLVRSNFLTSRNSSLFQGQSGGSRYLPYVFTEQGIYMLMTVLKGELAVQQSKTLIRLFKAMKDHLIGSSPVQLPYRFIEKIEDHGKQIAELQDTTIKKNDLPVFLKLFENNIGQEEVLILNGEPFKADLAFQQICAGAESSLILIDDYISAKTLQHLSYCPSGTAITVISDNRGAHPLRLSEYTDFCSEYPAASPITFLQSCRKVHDRYLILDHRNDMQVYHCGASLKDSGKRITTLTRLCDIAGYREMILDLLNDPFLVLS